MVLAMQEVTYAGARCAKLANKQLELYASLDVGPRIIGLQLAGESNNILKTYPEQLANPNPDQFELYGGHRLWAAPEIAGFTDEPDGKPLDKAHMDGGALVLEGALGVSKLRKQIRVWIDNNQVHLQHTLTNEGDEPVEVALWALSVMEAGGVGLTPQGPYVPHGETLDPERPLVMWPYTRMNDPRVRWGNRMIRLNQHPSGGPFKYGAWLKEGLAGYWRNNLLFLKAFPPGRVENLLDFGCSFETFTREEMLEVESLSEKVVLAPGESASHPETWAIFTADAPPFGEDEGRDWFDQHGLKMSPWFLD